MSSIGSAAVRPDTLRSRLVQSSLTGLLGTSLDRLLMPRRGAGGYATRQPARSPGIFAQQFLDRLGVRTVCRGAPDLLPSRGGLIVVANHPYGGLEGLVLYTLLAGRRTDVRVLGHDLIRRLPEFRPAVFGLDVRGGRSAAAVNAASLRRAVRWVRRGGALIVFPAAGVADLDPASRTVVDSPWHPSLARMVELTRAPVALAFVDGSNSALFHAAGFVHPRLKSALLERELLNKQRHTVEVTVGRPLPAVRLAAVGGDRSLTEHLRLQLYALACHDGNSPAGARPRGARQVSPSDQERIAAIGIESRLAAEVAALPHGRRQLAAGELEVWRAEPSRVPCIVREISEQSALAASVPAGELAASESSAADHEQLFVWDTRRHEVVAGIRVGAAGTVIGRSGVRGLLASTHFEVRPSLRSALNSVLEFGAGFVRPANEHGAAASLLLWHGVGVFLAEHPECRTLLGTLSMDGDYTPASRGLMAAYLQSLLAERTAIGRPHARNELPASTGVRRLRRELATIGSIGSVESVVLALEPMRRTLPILLRQFLQLGAKPIAVGTEGERSASLSVLMVAELPAADRRVMMRYFGRENAERLAPVRVAAATVKQPLGRPGRAGSRANSPHYARRSKQPEWLRALQ